MKASRPLIVAGIVTGSLLTLAPVLGLLAAAAGMTHVFNWREKSGISDPQTLANIIGTEKLYMATGLFSLLTGIVILALSLIAYTRLRASSPPPPPQEPAQ